jgi:hypothetical protein|tara:strand:- start:353 stop:730 length:378 start_codon:yes stop_codon:yes gene_type:complete
MDYKQIKNHIRTDNENLLKFINKDEIEWLNKHFKFINNLLMGKTKPTEKKYENFVDVIQNKKEPSTKPEKIYTKFAEYFNEQIKKSLIKPKDPNIIYDGMEVNPDGVRPAGRSVNNAFPRGPHGE